MLDKLPTGDGLALQALLYLSDALPQPDTCAFEERLAGDQKAREALAQAVSFVQTCAGDEPARPNPAYRQTVLRQVQPAQNWWQRLWRRREYPGHPILWGGISAAVVATLFLATGLLSSAPSSRGAALVDQASEPVQPEWVSADDGTDPEAARIWADLPRGDHLLKSHQELKRKQHPQRLPKREVH